MLDWRASAQLASLTPQVLHKPQSLLTGPEALSVLQDIGYLAPFASGQHDLIIDGAIYVTANEITWSGRTADLPPQFASADTILTLPHRIVIPGLVSSHAGWMEPLMGGPSTPKLLSPVACHRV